MREVDLRGLHEMIGVEVVPPVIDETDVLARIAVADRARIELSCVAAVARAQDGPPGFVEGVGETDPGGHIVPRERRVVTGECDPRHYVRESGVGSGAAGE